VQPHLLHTIPSRSRTSLNFCLQLASSGKTWLNSNRFIFLTFCLSTQIYSFFYFRQIYGYAFNFNISGTALAYDAFEALLDGIPARKKLLFIDACHSGEKDDDKIENNTDNNYEYSNTVADEGDRSIKVKHIKRDVFSGTAKISRQNSFELMKYLFADLRRGTGATIISSASAGEFALEGGVSKNGKVMANGVFTYVVKKALMDNNADKNKDGKITVTELRDYVFDKVVKYTGGRQHPTARRENLTVDFRVW